MFGHRFPKLCFANVGDSIQLLNAAGEPEGPLWEICATDAPGRKPAPKGASNGLYSDERKLYLRRIDGLGRECLRQLPHLSTRVCIFRRKEMKEAVRIETLKVGDRFKIPNNSGLFELCNIGTLTTPDVVYCAWSIDGTSQRFFHGDFLVIPESTESFEKNLSLLRPLDPAKLKQGDKLLHFQGEREVAYIAGPDEGGNIVIRDSNDRLRLRRAEYYRMKPLLWIAGRPVYPGDKLFHEGEAVFIHDHVGNVGWVTCSDGTRLDTKKMTWDRPKVKKEGWVNIYPGRTASNVHRSKEAADMEALENRIACSRVEWEE